MRETKEKLRRRLFRERQIRANLILAPVRTRLRSRQQLRTDARVEYYDNLARFQNARKYDLDFEEQGSVDNSNTVNRARESYCLDFFFYFLCCLWCYLVYLPYFEL